MPAVTRAGIANLINLGRAALAIAALIALAACDLPFGLGTASTRALENGAVASLDQTRSFRIVGSYVEGGSAWSVDLGLVRPSTEHLKLSSGSVDLEAILIGGDAYFRGQAFLSSHMGSDPLSRSLVSAAGNAWWKGSAQLVPALPDFTVGSSLRSTFLGAAVNDRIDHASVAGVAAVDLSGPRADVFVAEAPPYRLLGIHLKKGAAVDGITDAVLRYGSFDQDLGISVPSAVIDFSNLSTLPPIYTVVSVDTSRCANPCVLSASVRNLGGTQGAVAPSTVTFTMTDPQTSQVIGTCVGTVQPDVGHDATTTASCTVGGVNGGDHNAAVVTAVATNPGRA